MMRRTNLAVLVVAAYSLIFSGTALAGSLPAANSGTISFYVPGTATASSQPTYHGSLAFTTTGTDKLKNPLVWVECYQGGEAVYGEGGSPAEVFMLGGGSSLWVERGGGAATCTAKLYYILNAKKTAEWNGNGAQGGFVVLGLTTFEAAG